MLEREVVEHNIRGLFSAVMAEAEHYRRTAAIYSDAVHMPFGRLAYEKATAKAEVCEQMMSKIINYSHGISYSLSRGLEASYREYCQRVLHEYQ